MDCSVFCRAVYNKVMQDVRKHVPAHLVKEAWGYNYGDGHVEFQIPSVKYYWHGQGCCLYQAKYEGWCAYLRKQGVVGYTLGDD